MTHSRSHGGAKQTALEKKGGGKARVKGSQTAIRCPYVCAGESRRDGDEQGNTNTQNTRRQKVEASNTVLKKHKI